MLQWHRVFILRSKYYRHSADISRQTSGIRAHWNAYDRYQMENSLWSPQQGSRSDAVYISLQRLATHPGVNDCGELRRVISNLNTLFWLVGCLPPPSALKHTLPLAHQLFFYRSNTKRITLYQLPRKFLIEIKYLWMVFSNMSQTQIKRSCKSEW